VNAIVLENPKFPHNVGAVLRAASCYNIPELIITGNRVSLTPYDGYRLPREERMRGYKDVEVYNDNKPIDRYPKTPIIGVEIVPNAIPLTFFTHPDEAVYVFGPEDGSISKGLRTVIHQFIFIPTRHCLNLSAAVYTVLYDRQTKAQLEGKIPVLSMEETLGGGQVEGDMRMYDGSAESALASRTA
jgi:tRNA(Leu) C34 or U34 (ribose-2'-O)-methylase TrmL